MAGEKGKKAPSPRTYEARTYDLAHFCRYLDDRQLSIEHVGSTDLTAYLATLTTKGPDGAGTSKYSPRTLGRRMDTLSGFYAHLEKTGQIGCRPKVPTSYHRARDETGNGPTETIETAYLDSAGGGDRAARAIPPEAVQKIMVRLGPLPADLTTYSSLRIPRDRLMFEFCLQAGLRRAEVTLLRTNHIFAASSAVTAPLNKYPLQVLGKGMRWRTIEVPGWLLVATADYISTERSWILMTKRERGPFEDHGHVFVQAQRNPKHLGGPIQPKHLDTIFSRAAIAAGYPYDAHLHVRRPARRAAYTVHGLRHTYAVQTYLIRKRTGDAEPWVYIQCQLGHRSLSTTLRIYLNLVHHYEVSAAELYAAVLEQGDAGDGRG
jgi:integrase